jgi:glycosyltransferase involved in cell wall biosynthesis
MNASDIPLAPTRPLLTLIVPCYNEASGLAEFLGRLQRVLIQLPHYDHEIICIDDGSSDDTLGQLQRHAQEDPHITVVELSRNFGKENALTAGLDLAEGDAVVPIDADLQHPPELILEMLKHWEQGADMVLAKRKSRDDTGRVQRWLTGVFYRLHNRMSDCHIPADVGDFRLMDRKVVASLRRLTERTRFMKGLYAWVGFKQVTVEFDVEPRRTGKTSFNSKRLFRLALDGIVSFSTLPLSLWVALGTGIAALALFYGVWIIVSTLWFGIAVAGYASLLTAILFLGGVQLIGIGVLGQYIGNTYNETKKRPLYLVRQLQRGSRTQVKSDAR